MKGSFTVLSQEVEEASSSANYTSWLIFLTLDSLGCCSAKLNSDGRGKYANNPKYREGDIRSELSRRAQNPDSSLTLSDTPSHGVTCNVKLYATKLTKQTPKREPARVALSQAGLTIFYF